MFFVAGNRGKKESPCKKGEFPQASPGSFVLPRHESQYEWLVPLVNCSRSLLLGIIHFTCLANGTWDFEGISDFQSRAKMNRFCKTCTDLKLDIDCCWLLVLDHGTFLSMVGLSSSTNSVVEVEEHHDHIHSHLQIKEAAELFLGLPWLSIVFHVKCPTSRSDDEREWGIRWNSRDLIVLMSLVLVPWYLKSACRVEQLSALNFWLYNPSVW